MARISSDMAEAEGALTLPARLDLPAARPLAEAIRTRAGQDLVLDAGAVTHLGGLCLQILLAARGSWAGRGGTLRISPRSEAFEGALDAFGLSTEALETSGTGPHA